VLQDLSRANSYGLAFDEPLEATLARAAEPEAGALRQSMDHFSTYLDANWGDFATPPAEPGFRALAEKLRSSAPRVPLALELGCGVGRGAYEMAQAADLVVGLDLSGASLRRARAMVNGEEVRYARRLAGRHYTAAAARAPALKNVQFICGDALDPPFSPGVFGRVAAMSLLDNVPSPRALLHHIDQLAAPGADLLLASPYVWRDDIVEPAERIGGADPAAAMREEVRALGWTLAEEAALPWTLRHDARTETAYSTHFIRMKK
jgi:SAM-dependent methyltransferase